METTQTGLDGVVAARTRLSHVDGEAGRLTIAGFAVEEIAPRVSFEEMLCLLWTGDLPHASERDRMAAELRAGAELPDPVLDSLQEGARRGCAPMHAMRAAVGGRTRRAAGRGSRAGTDSGATRTASTISSA